MSSDKQRQEPAFPDPMRGGNLVGHQCEPHPGMSLRDWFAGQAIQGAWTNESNVEVYAGGKDFKHVNVHQVLAERAYSLADAMMKAREA